MENKLLINYIEDRYRKFQREYSIVATDFYDLASQSLLNGFVREHAAEGVYFYGGYEDAERRGIVFVPDYLDIKGEDELISYFKENPRDCPFAVLSARIGQKGASLRHSDYLGSLLALGVRREKTGDILVSGEGAQILTAADIAPYLAENYIKAGRIPLSVRAVTVDELVITPPELKRIRTVISSPRLDNAVSAAFEVSRKAAAEAINRGLVFVNSTENRKPDFHLKGGEKLVLRGKGKAIYIGVCGSSRKGKDYVEFDRYI